MTYPNIETERVIMRLLKKSEASKVIDYYQKNKMHLSATMPKYHKDFFQTQYWQKKLINNQKEFELGKSCRLFILDKKSQLVIGTINFTEIIRGPYQGCFLGYGIDHAFQGRGIMTESLKSAIQYVWKELNLHKISANYLPVNKASGRILEKLGFYEVGIAKKELYLQGQWQDHIETRLINTQWVNIFSEE
jgi:ribosomal-protein-alanine N-acetyltransferase